MDDSQVIPLYHDNHTRLVLASLKGFPGNHLQGNIYAQEMYFIVE